MFRLLTIIAIVFMPLYGSSQTYQNNLFDAGMQNTLQFTKSEISPDSTVVSLSMSGARKLVLSKARLDGKVMWSKILEFSSQAFYDLDVGEEGEVYALTNIEAPTGAIRHWIMLYKFDTEGELIWTKTSASYHDFKPKVLKLHNDQIHISGEILTSDTQVFYLKLDTAGKMVHYDSRRAKYQEQVWCMTPFKDWMILGGEQWFGGAQGPLFIAIDPGGNIRYFYHIPQPESAYVTAMLANSDSLWALAGKHIVTFDDVVEHHMMVHEIQKGGDLRLYDLEFDQADRPLICGGIPIAGGFTLRPLLLHFGDDIQTPEASFYRDHDRTQWFRNIRQFDSDLVLSGNRHINHYYGYTVAVTDSLALSLCERRDTNLSVKSDKVGVFTYVPSSTIANTNMQSGFANPDSLDISSQVICRVESPRADFSLTVDTLCVGECISPINTSTGATHWEWTFSGPGGSVMLNQKSPKWCYSKPGPSTIKLVVRNSAGADSVTKQLMVLKDECEEYLYVGNAFSPNDRAPNDQFVVLSNLDVPINMQIYNRHGEKLHETEALQPMWDGKYQGKMCAQGVYIFILQYQDRFGNEKKYSGTVTLLR